jgi:hypothetical protein
MAPRNIDAPPRDDLSHLCSRQHEDYLDWLENQGRSSWDLFKAFRLLAGAVVGVAVLLWTTFLAF